MNKDIMTNRNINGLDDETIKVIRTKLNERYNSVSHDDIMEDLMRRMGMYEQKTSTDTTNSDESETPNQQSVNDVNKHIVNDVEKQYIHYPMSEAKRKQHKLKRKKLKKLNRK